MKYFRELKVGEVVKVYRNLNRSCWSVRDSKDHVIAHLIDYFILEDVTFVVRPAGKQLAMNTGQRNFHAYAKGRYKDADVLLGGKITGFVPEISVRYSALEIGGFIATKKATQCNPGFVVQCPNASKAVFLPNGKVNIRI